nr:MAG TPA: hypothetical protein [Caudoviricetes sp.]
MKLVKQKAFYWTKIKNSQVNGVLLDYPNSKNADF